MHHGVPYSEERAAVRSPTPGQSFHDAGRGAPGAESARPETAGALGKWAVGLVGTGVAQGDRGRRPHTDMLSV